jgi:hypothetical protein
VRELPRPWAQVLTQQPVLLRLQVVLRLVVQTLVQTLVQALALVQAPVPVPAQQEHLLPVLQAQNRVGLVVLAYRLPDELLVEQGGRLRRYQSDGRVLGERHRRDGYRLRALNCHRGVGCRCRRWPPEEEVQWGGQGQDLKVRDRRLQQRHRVQDERCDRLMRKVKRRRRRE